MLVKEKDELHLHAAAPEGIWDQREKSTGLIAFLRETIGCPVDGNTQYSADSLRRLMSGQSEPVSGKRNLSACRSEKARPRHVTYSEDVVRSGNGPLIGWQRQLIGDFRQFVKYQVLSTVLGIYDSAFPLSNTGNSMHTGDKACHRRYAAD